MNDSLGFIDSNKNDEFSNLKCLDLKELINQIENFYLTYRKNLGLLENLSFGVEIEYENVEKEVVDRFINKEFPDWESKSDLSLNSGGEITSPKLYDRTKDWDNLKKICKFLKMRNANTSEKAGGHIHVGAHILENNIEYWQTFIQVYIVYESVLARFLYGDKLNARSTMLEYAAPIADQLYGKLDQILKERDICKFFNIIPLNFHDFMNFDNVNFDSSRQSKKFNTIECRGANATTDEVIWQNNINAITKLLLVSSKNIIDLDLINYKLKNERISSQNDYYMYNKVNLKNALEFVDLVFDNNLDKCYFLRQYFKCFQETDDLNIVSAKRFTK